jgi:hypothetical protein
MKPATAQTFLAIQRGLSGQSTLLRASCPSPATTFAAMVAGGSSFDHSLLSGIWISVLPVRELSLRGTVSSSRPAMDMPALDAADVVSSNWSLLPLRRVPPDSPNVPGASWLRRIPFLPSVPAGLLSKRITERFPLRDIAMVIPEPYPGHQLGAAMSTAFFFFW